MTAGVPLDDADRLPWLRDLAEWIRGRDRRGTPTVMTCSALRRSYRDVLRQGAGALTFVHLDHAYVDRIRAIEMAHRRNLAMAYGLEKRFADQPFWTRRLS